MSGVNSVSRHEEASVDGCSFALHGGLTAQQNLAICVKGTPKQFNSTGEIEIWKDVCFWFFFFNFFVTCNK